jgi:pSer/pThr/pTyr-binding forkhead associated (FHA) protein
MLDITLTYPTSEGSQSINLDRDRTSFGRGSEADHRFPDDGLSRLHATVYRDGDRVWVVDENSTNGTFVNGQPVSGSGTPLRDGDTIKIGNNTNLTLRIAQAMSAVTPSAAGQSAQVQPSAAATQESSGSFVPVIIIAMAILVISVSAVFIGFTVLGSGGEPEIVHKTDDDDVDTGNEIKKDATPSTSPKTESSKTAANSTPDNTVPDNIDPANTSISVSTPPSVKKYQEMSDTERRQYLEVRAMKVAQVIGNRNAEAIPAAAVDKIKAFADGYASRIRAKVRTGSCGFSDNLQSTYERASKNAPFIVKAFNEKGIDPRIGLYLAMIESEHCTCLQSGTGPLGMFQFTYATAKLHFVPSDGVIKGASPANPDERCKPEPSARAAASYMKALTGRYGTGPSSVPLAIGSYNSGEGGLSQNLQKALDSGQGLPRDFWTLIAKGDILSKQFQSENFKYVPKFFAAAIIGENPQDFGLNLQPISTYSK